MGGRGLARRRPGIPGALSPGDEDDKYRRRPRQAPRLRSRAQRAPHRPRYPAPQRATSRRRTSREDVADDPGESGPGGARGGGRRMSAELVIRLGRIQCHARDGSARASSPSSASSPGPAAATPRSSFLFEADIMPAAAGCAALEAACRAPSPPGRRRPGGRDAGGRALASARRRARSPRARWADGFR